MDQATASELAARLLARRLIARRPAEDRRAWSMNLTRTGSTLLSRSIEATRHEIQHADSRGELAALRESLAAYLDYYTGRSRRGRRKASPARRKSAGRSG